MRALELGGDGGGTTAPGRPERIGRWIRRGGLAVAAVAAGMALGRAPRGAFLERGMIRDAVEKVVAGAEPAAAVASGEVRTAVFALG